MSQVTFNDRKQNQINLLRRIKRDVDEVTSVLMQEFGPFDFRASALRSVDQALERIIDVIKLEQEDKLGFLYEDEPYRCPKCLGQTWKYHITEAGEKYAVCMVDEHLDFCIKFVNRRMIEIETEKHVR